MKDKNGLLLLFFGYLFFLLSANVLAINITPVFPFPSTVYANTAYYGAYLLSASPNVSVEVKSYDIAANGIIVVDGPTTFRMPVTGEYKITLKLIASSTCNINPEIYVTDELGSSKYLLGTIHVVEAQKPVVDKVDPIGGSINGGTSVEIRGSGFNCVTAVYFGNNKAKFKVNNDKHITAISSPNIPGIEYITVASPNVTSEINGGARFQYVTGPHIFEIKPDIGQTAGGTKISIGGINLKEVKTVMFGFLKRQVLTEGHTDTQVIVKLPPNDKGIVGIRAFTQSKESEELNFTYYDRFWRSLPLKMIDTNEDKQVGKFFFDISQNIRLLSKPKFL